MAKASKEIIQKHEQMVLPVVIDSYGGQVYSLMSMISDIQHSRIPVATIVQGKAMSCGAILFSFGTEGRRYMDPDATVMIHDVSSMGWGKVEEIKADAKEVERLNQKVYKMMATSRRLFSRYCPRKGSCRLVFGCQGVPPAQACKQVAHPRVKDRS